MCLQGSIERFYFQYNQTSVRLFVYFFMTMILFQILWHDLQV